MSVGCLFVCFFFKQKTAYEMVIIYWISDVCSSDLIIDHVETHHLAFAKADEGGRHRAVHADRSGLASVDDHGVLRNPQGNVGARHSRKRSGKAQGYRLSPCWHPGSECGCAACKPYSSQKPSAIEVCKVHDPQSLF